MGKTTERNNQDQQQLSSQRLQQREECQVGEGQAEK